MEFGGKFYAVGGREEPDLESEGRVVFLEGNTQDQTHADSGPEHLHRSRRDFVHSPSLGPTLLRQPRLPSGRNLCRRKPVGASQQRLRQVPHSALRGLQEGILRKEPKIYARAAITNFYWNNIMHDIFYQNGFNEVAGNFQSNNWGKGGNGNDYVIADAQDGSGTNNANFATPPDGQSGRMRIYLFTLNNPNRDADLDSDVLIHEYAHGISNRLTGGPANVDCLADGEAGGMGEGWGDFFAVALKMRSTDKRTRDVGVGEYLFNGKTIRTYLYSTSKTTNPTTYEYLNNPEWQEVHATGEIWANILYEMYWNLMEETRHFNPDWYSADKTAGNTLALQVVVDGMKLQPCNPSFVMARDAILQAYKANTGRPGCVIWRAFAKRGVGVHAASSNGVVTSDFTVPASC